ncbi:MAG TPA: dihydrolipoyl dehydrogenase [Polyangiaceae bacterium]|nr:dihydrolipoyl dehydrogenase [Polyangiaceae bacterium]
MADSKFDAVVLGGGPGGYVCAIRLAQLGIKTACIETEQVGGVCLNWGCIPSKALITNAHHYVKSQHLSSQGITFGSTSLDVPTMQAWKDGIVNKLTSGIRGLFKSNGVTLIEGRGELKSERQLAVTTRDGAVMEIEATRAVVIATGSSTIEVPGFEFDSVQVIGAREAVSLKQIPKRMLVIGGGVIGLELGMVYQSFGSELTVVELTNTLLPGIEADAVRIVEKRITARGGKVYKGTRAEGYTKKSDGTLQVKIATGSDAKTVDCDVILVAVGMRPRSRGLGLEAIGVQIDERGFVRTDAQCRTNVSGIYAIGDVSGAPMLAHKASKEGEVCAEVIAGKAAAKDWVAIPGVVFTDPEVAAAGLTEEKAKEKGIEVTVGRFPFAALGRAMALGETDGFVKVIADKKTTRVLGITVVGPNASDLISEAMLALEMGASAEDLSLTMHPHPTLGEATMEAAAAALGHAVHVANRR